LKVQASQYGRAAALHNVVVVLSADALAADPAAGLCARRVGAGLCAGMESELESAGLSERRLVLQSVCLAIAVCVRRLVCARRRGAADCGAALAGGAGDRDHLPLLRFLGNLDVVCPSAQPFRSPLVEGLAVSN